MAKNTTLTGKLIALAIHLVPLRSGRISSTTEGFIYTRIAGRWCGGWYGVYTSAVALVSGTAQAQARRIDGLPGRFAGLLLLCKMFRANTPGMVCR